MPRRRRNRSGGGALKKVPRLQQKDDSDTKCSSKIAEPQTRARTRRQRSTAAGARSVTKQTKVSKPSEVTNLSVPVGANSVFVESVGEVGEELSTDVVRDATDPLSLVTSHYPESSTEAKGDVKLNVSSPASFVDVKLEVDDENEVLFCNEEKGSDSTVNPIKSEALECGVQIWGNTNPVICRVESLGPIVLDPSIVAEVQRSLNAILPQDWFCKDAEDGFNVMLLSRCKEKAIQRRLFFPFSGGMEVSVHRKPLPMKDVNELLGGSFPLPPITPDSYQMFVELVMKIVEKFWSMEVCSGADPSESVMWANECGGRVDENPYGEIRYKRTFRSINCRYLVLSQKWRCRECSRLLSILKKKSVKKSESNQIIKKVPGKVQNRQLTKRNDSKVKEKDAPAPALRIPQNERNIPNLSLSIDSNNKFILKGGGTPNLVIASIPQSHITKGSVERIISEPVPSVGQNLANHSVLTLNPKIHVSCRKDGPNAYQNVESTVESKTHVSYEKVGPNTYQTKSLIAPGQQNVLPGERFFSAELEKCGVTLDPELSDDFMAVLTKSPLTPVQRQMLDKQVELANTKKTFGMRWHPILLRFALFFRSTSSEKFRTTGMITLPGGRNLFNFSQVLFRISEFQKANVSELFNKVSTPTSDLPKTYHILILDEIEVCRNLVFQKSNGELIGYVKLSDIKTEMDQLEALISVGRATTYNPKSYTMLVYMVKGMSNGMRELVGLLDSSFVSPETVYEKTWDIIGSLEDNGVKVLGVVSNGSSLTRCFFALHTPAMRTESGQIFCTVNTKAHGRLLYYFIDASFLLKEFRNCFEESGSPSPKQKTLTRLHEPIVWSTIVKLYGGSKPPCPNLNAQNVFLTEFSRKRASHAASVMHALVAKDIQSRFWAYTSETIRFINQVHDFFQCLLNSDVSEGKQPKQIVSSYKRLDDPRFTKLVDFLGYLHAWKLEIESIPNLSSEERSRLLLDEAILKDTEMLVKSFRDAVTFLIKEGVKEIYPNSFWIEPIGKFLERGWFGFVQTVCPFNALT